MGNSNVDSFPEKIKMAVKYILKIKPTAGEALFVELDIHLNSSIN